MKKYNISDGGTLIMKENKNDDYSLRLSQIERLVDEFKKDFADKTSDADNFITMSEIEKMWGNLKSNTNNIYADMISDAIGSIDEKDLIRKKKENTGQEE